jgi:hypothetical protein
MAWFPIARALIKMSYANLPASMDKPRADLEWTLPAHDLVGRGNDLRPEPPAAVSSIVHCGNANPGATSVNIMHTRVPMPYPLDFGLRREHAVRPHQIADHAEPLFPGRHAALSIQLDQQHETWRVLLESRLNDMMDFGVEIDSGRSGAAASRSTAEEAAARN